MRNTESLQNGPKRRVGSYLLGLAMLSLLFAGCTTTKSGASGRSSHTRRNEIPRIHSIGTSNMLVYDQSHALTIPIKGAYFADETLIWSITVTGVSPLEEGIDYTISHPDGFSSNGDKTAKTNLGSERANIMHLILTDEYIKRVKTGDTLSIEVSIADGTEHLALEKVAANDTKIHDLLDQLTAELNTPESNEQKIGKMVAELISLLHESNDYIAKLRPSPKTASQLAMFDQDVKVIRNFMVRRKPIPTNLRDERKFRVRATTDDATLLHESNDVTAETTENESPEESVARDKDQSHNPLDVTIAPGELDSWGSLERRLQEIAARQRSMVSRRKAQTVRAPLLSSATRQFILYEVSDYRKKVLSARIPVHDISAYPLPGSETQKLFGKTIASMYFVVRLSVRNTTEEDQLISTGLIKAYGRALVNNGDDSTQFTIPVQIVPQSREHIYTIVADGRKDSPRNIVFRSLEFTGTLLTALIQAFDPTVKSLQWAGLFTGMLLPAADKALPDKIPAYLSNLVNFSMPDLIKVPRNGVMGHKYLFFSKGDLQAMISDTKYAKNAIKGVGPVVVYMAFDSLHIPFENTRQPGSDEALAAELQERHQLALDKEKAINEIKVKSLGNELDTAQKAVTETKGQLTLAQAKITNLEQELKEADDKKALAAEKRKISVREIEAVLADTEKQEAVHRHILATWCREAGSQLYGPWQLSPASFSAKEKLLADLAATNTFAGSGLPAFDKQLPKIKQIIGEWQKAMAAIAPASVRQRLGGASEGAMQSLEQKRKALELHRERVKAGLTDLNQRLVDEMKSEIKTAQALVKTYQYLAIQLASTPIEQRFAAATDADTLGLQRELEALLSPLKQIENARGDTGLYPTLRPNGN